MGKIWNSSGGISSMELSKTTKQIFKGQGLRQKETGCTFNKSHTNVFCSLVSSNFGLRILNIIQNKTNCRLSQVGNWQDGWVKKLKGHRVLIK